MILDDCYKGFLNMPHRTDRLQHMTKQLSRINLEAVRHEGKNIKAYNPNDLNIQVMKNRTPGAVGCHFGQVGIMEKALENDQHAFVMEDDIVFCEDFNKRLAIAGEYLSGNEWDILWLGGTFHVPAFWHKKGQSGMMPNCSAQLGHDCETTDNERIIRTYGAFSTYAYIVNNKSILKIFDLFDQHLKTSIGIDWLFIKLQPQLKCFAFVPGCTKQIDNQSDIGDGMTIFSGFSKLNGTTENSRYWYQNLMTDFDPKTFNFNQ